MRIYIANWRTGAVIRPATLDEIRAARRTLAGEWLVTYQTGGTPRDGYLVRVLDDDHGTVIPLADDDRAAILEGK